MDWVELPDLRHAILASYIMPGELTARYDPDGAVRVTVTDLYTPSMECSVAYDPASLDWVKEHMGQLGYRAGEREEQNKPGVADIMLLELPNGERELLYRTPANDGQYMWYDSVPWSNSITLLPFSGKDFMVLDQVDGKVYTSADGVAWTAVEQDWTGGTEYAFAWTGTRYLACTGGDEVLFLDEGFHETGAYRFAAPVTAVGALDGTLYAQAGETLYRSADGETWEPIDVLQVRDALVRTR